MPFLRVEINFLSAILSKTEQGSTLLKENILAGAHDTQIDQRLANSFCIGPQTLTINYLYDMFR